MLSCCELNSADDTVFLAFGGQTLSCFYNTVIVSFLLGHLSADFETSTSLFAPAQNLEVTQGIGELGMKTLEPT